MSREIKFRVWDGEAMYDATSYPDWTLDHFVNMPIMAKEYRPNPDRFKLMQYTGLKDKNGKEIYEGDVVEFDGYQNPDSGDTEMNIGEVRYVGPSLCYYEDGKDVYIEDVIGHGCDVDDCAMILGNIYENPELLTK